MKSSSVAVLKWVPRASAASQDFVEGSRSTSKDQNANAIAAEPLYQSELTASFARKARVKGLQRVGKQGWLDGILEKGGSNYAVGVGSKTAQDKYVTNSGRYDTERTAADKLPKGPKGGALNMARITAVVTALHAKKLAA